MTGRHSLVAPRRKTMLKQRCACAGMASMVAISALLLLRCNDDSKPSHDAALPDQGVADAPTALDAGPPLGDALLDSRPDTPGVYCPDPTLERVCVLADNSTCCLDYYEDYCPTGTTVCNHWDSVAGDGGVTCPVGKFCVTSLGCFCTKANGGKCAPSSGCAAQCTAKPACWP